MTRKVVHSGTGTPSQHSKKYYFTPEKTPSPCGSRLLLGEFTPAKKSASIKCLPASFFRYSSTGKLVLDRTDSALHLTPHKPSAQALSQSASKAKAVPMGQRQVWRFLPCALGVFFSALALGGSWFCFVPYSEKGIVVEGLTARGLLCWVGNGMHFCI